jgi:predicted Zn-dependent protease
VREPERPQRNPGAVASLQLTEQGKMLLKKGEPDAAISILERAVNLNPSNGQNYYYLAEAWLFKGERDQADEFNRLAELYLGTQPDWAGRVREQKDRIRGSRRQ